MSEKIQVECPCGEQLSVQVEMLGKQGLCPACGDSFLIWSSEVVKTAGDRNWYVEMDGRSRGPVSFIELRRLVSEGRVTRESLVRYGTDGGWVPAHEVRGDVDVTVPKQRMPSARRRRTRKTARKAPRKRQAIDLSSYPLRLGIAAVVTAGLLVLFLLVTGGNGGEGEAKPLTAAQITSRALPSVAVVRGRQGSGSGFVVAPGVVITNYHVIEKELLRNVVIEFPDARGARRGFTPMLRLADPDADLAFLSIDAEVEPLPLAEAHEFRAGQEIMVVGSPGLGSGGIVLNNAIARGLLSTRTQLDGQPYYQLDVSVNPGNSGGPVLDEQGKVIGVVAAKATQGEHLAFAVPLSEVLSGLGRLERVTEARARKAHAHHRLRVAELTILAATRIYHRSMIAYVRSLDPQAAGSGAFGEFLKDLDRHLLADLRLEEREIRRDYSLTSGERERFGRLWTLLADLTRAVDDPQGSLREYAAQCSELGNRMQSLEKEVLGAPVR